MAEVGAGDKLARGAHSAQFETPQVSQEKWNEAFGEADLSWRRKVVSEEESQKFEEEKKEEAKKFAVEKKAKNTLPEQIPFRAVQDRVVVFRFEEEETPKNVIERPDDAKEKPAEGVVVAVGPGKFVFGQFVPVTVEVGEHVFFGKYSGQEVQIEGTIFLTLREEDIFLVLNRKTENK